MFEIQESRPRVPIVQRSLSRRARARNEWDKTLDDFMVQGDRKVYHMAGGRAQDSTSDYLVLHMGGGDPDPIR